jgi:hypothetical protein
MVREPARRWACERGLRVPQLNAMRSHCSRRLDRGAARSGLSAGHPKAAHGFTSPTRRAALGAGQPLDLERFPKRADGSAVLLESLVGPLRRRVRACSASGSPRPTDHLRGDRALASPRRSHHGSGIRRCITMPRAQCIVSTAAMPNDKSCRAAEFFREWPGAATHRPCFRPLASCSDILFSDRRRAANPGKDEPRRWVQNTPTTGVHHALSV